MSARILATDVRTECLRQARAGWYPRSSLREVDEARLARAFRADRGGYVVEPEARALVAFAPHDLARDPWPRELDLVLIRGSVFTYGGDALARDAVERAATSLSSHRFLAIGEDESLPRGSEALFLPEGEGMIPLYRKRS